VLTKLRRSLGSLAQYLDIDDKSEVVRISSYSIQTVILIACSEPSKIFFPVSFKFWVSAWRLVTKRAPASSLMSLKHYSLL
jgi:hypothetical protein